MQCNSVMVVRIEKRAKEAVKVQEVLTKYGCNISARFGIHESGEQCSDIGMIMLCLSGTADETSSLSKELGAIPGVKVNSMKLD